MSRSRSPSPYKGNYRRRRSRSTSPTVLTKEEQLKKIADITISNVGRRRDYNDIFGDEKTSGLPSNQRREAIPTSTSKKPRHGGWKPTKHFQQKKRLEIYWEIWSSVRIPSTKSKSHALTSSAETILKNKFRTSGTTHYSNARSPRTSTTSKHQAFHQCHITTWPTVLNNTTTNHPPDALHQSSPRTTTQSSSYIHAHWKKSRKKRANHLTGTIHMSHIEHRLSSCHTSMT